MEDWYLYFEESVSEPLDQILMVRGQQRSAFETVPCRLGGAPRAGFRV
jgi:hypothetical protein